MKRANAVVVGAGAAGGIVAKELSTAGLSVVLLERGKWYTANDCRKDDLRNQRVTVLGNAFGPEDEGNPRVSVDARGVPHIVLPSEGGYQNDAACVGGGTLSWGAQAWRFLPQDFKMRSTYGAPPGSSLEDWPISYDDLEPFYEKAEYEIGISGDYSGTPFHGPRRRPLPMPPLPVNREFEILEPAARRLDEHVRGRPAGAPADRTRLLQRHEKRVGDEGIEPLAGAFVGAQVGRIGAGVPRRGGDLGDAFYGAYRQRLGHQANHHSAPPPRAKGETADA